jgi:hypothetical protein
MMALPLCHCTDNTVFEVSDFSLRGPVLPKDVSLETGIIKIAPRESLEVVDGEGTSPGAWNLTPRRYPVLLDNFRLEVCSEHLG